MMQQLWRGDSRAVSGDDDDDDLNRGWIDGFLFPLIVNVLWTRVPNEKRLVGSCNGITLLQYAVTSHCKDDRNVCMTWVCFKSTKTTIQVCVAVLKFCTVKFCILSVVCYIFLYLTNCKFDLSYVNCFSIILWV